MTHIVVETVKPETTKPGDKSVSKKVAINRVSITKTCSLHGSI